MKFKAHERRKKDIEEPQELNPLLVNLLDRLVSKYTFTPKESTNTEDHLEILEKKKVAIFINTIHNLLTLQFRNSKNLDKPEISDKEVLRLLPEIRNRIEIPENIYQGIHLALIEFLNQRKVTRRLVSNDISIKKNLIRNKLKQDGLTLDDSAIYELASNMRVEDGVFGCFIYLDRETFLKYQNRPGLSGIFYKLNYKPNFYKKNKQSYDLPIPMQIIGGLNPSMKISYLNDVRVHEEMHGFYEFITNKIKTTQPETKFSWEDFEKEKTALLNDYKQESGDINDINSEKYKKYRLLIEFVVKTHASLFKSEFYNELCARLEGAFANFKRSKLTYYFKNEIDGFISAKNYQWRFLQGSNEIKRIFNDPNLENLIKQDVNNFNQELMNEYLEIRDLVLEIIKKHPDLTRLVIYLIITSDLNSVKNNLQNLSNFYDSHDRSNLNE